MIVIQSRARVCNHKQMSNVDEVYKLITTFCKKNNIYTPDRVQDYAWDVWTKLESYDDKKAAISTYIFAICKNLYLEEIRKNNSNKRKGLIIDIDTPIGDKNITLSDTIKSNYRTPSEQYAIDIALNNCNELLTRYLNGEKQCNLAKEYHVSQSQVCRLIRQEIERIKKF